MGFPQVLTTKEQKEVYSPETTNYSKINDFVVNLYLVFFVAIFLWFNGQYVCVVRALVQTRKKSDKKTAGQRRADILSIPTWRLTN